MKTKLDFKQELARNSAYQITSTLLDRGGGLIFTIVLARILQPKLFGLYGLALTITLILMTLANLGINEAMLRYVSIYYEKRQYKKAKTYFLFLTKLKISILLLVSLILILLAKPIALIYNNPDLAFPLLISAGYLLFFSLSRFFVTLFFSFKKVKNYAINEIIFQVTRLLLLPLIILFPSFYQVEFVFFLIMISSIVSLIYILFILKQNFKFLFNAPPTKIKKRELLNYIFFLAIGSLSGIFFIYVDTLFLGFFVTTEFIGYYKSASLIVIGVASFMTISGVLYPIFASSEGDRLKLIFNKTFYYVSILSIPASIGLSLIAKPFIRALFGEAYLPATIPLMVLSFFIFTLTSGELLIILFNAKGKSKITATAMFIATVLNIVLNLVLILYFLKFGPIYATLGAAIATIASRFVLLILLLGFFKSKMSFFPDLPKLFKPLLASIIMVLFLYTFNRYFSQNMNLFLGILEIISAMVIYFAALILIKGINREDVVLIRSIIKRR